MIRIEYRITVIEDAKDPIHIGMALELTNPFLEMDRNDQIKTMSIKNAVDAVYKKILEVLEIDPKDDPHSRES